MYVANVAEMEDVAYKESAAKIEANIVCVQPERRQRQDEEY
jgi:hypothetical protein